MPEINVLIVDDHPVVCKGIRNLLEPAMGVKVAGEAHTGAEALQMVKALKPDVVLLDMRLPDMTGIEIIKEIYATGSTTRILGLSSYNDREFISQLLNHGASGYLLKDEMPDQILEAIRGVAHGESGWVSRKVAAMLSQIILREKEGGGTDLTPRELDVLSMVVNGKTNDQIGVSLGISVKTVENHLHTIFRKMGVVSRVEAAVMAVRESLV
jgi:DNA-binding NarL/FixJ family response regulator